MSSCSDITRPFSFYEFQDETHIVLVPTYIKDGIKYCHLISSFIRSRIFYSDRILFVTVFSSEKERDMILHNCLACYNNTNIILTSLIFDVSYVAALLEGTHFTPIDNNKFNYQTAKKIWAVSQLPLQSKVVVVDSDCLFVNPTIDIRKQIDKRINLMYKGSQVPSKLDRHVFASSNKLIGSGESDYNVFTLPWIVQPFHVRNLIEYLRIRLPQLQPSLRHILFDNKTDSNYMTTMHALALYSEIVFEVVLSNKFILKTDPSYFKVVSVPSNTYQPLFEYLWPVQIHPPIIAFTREQLHNGHCCPDCWVMYHADRSCAMPNYKCYGEHVMLGFNDSWLNVPDHECPIAGDEVELGQHIGPLLIWIGLAMLFLICVAIAIRKTGLICPALNILFLKCRRISTDHRPPWISLTETNSQVKASEEAVTRPPGCG